MPRNPIDTWQEELDLLINGPVNLKNVLIYYISMAINFFKVFLFFPAGKIVTAVFVVFLVWQFWRVAVRPLSPANKLRRRIGLVLLALAYVLTPAAVTGLSIDSLITWIFVLPPVVLLIAALYLLLVPTRRKGPNSDKKEE